MSLLIILIGVLVSLCLGIALIILSFLDGKREKVYKFSEID